MWSRWCFRGCGGSARSVTVDWRGGEAVANPKADVVVVDVVVALFASEKVSNWLGPFAEAEPEDEAEG